MLNIDLGTSSPLVDRLFVNVSINDNPRHRIGLHITSTPSIMNAMILGGTDSNAFTGDTIIDGLNTCLSLNKANGATAIQGDIFMENGGRLCLWRGDQIADTATITMSNRSVVGLPGIGREKIHKLVVKGGSYVYFESPKSDPKTNYFYLDDLLISDDASLTIQTWHEGRDFFLVRKDSEHLQDALSKIKFEGWGDAQAGVREYDNDYWQIGPGFPEPATYGAIFGAVGLGLAIWRKRWRLAEPVVQNTWSESPFMACRLTRG